MNSLLPSQDSVQCALEMTRLQLEDWKRMQGPRAQEGALTQKALLLEELVTIRARMCDVSLVRKIGTVNPNRSVKRRFNSAVQ